MTKGKVRNRVGRMLSPSSLMLLPLLMLLLLLRWLSAISTAVVIMSIPSIAIGIIDLSLRPRLLPTGG